ncbi:hypothetical protein PACTADRAFT_48120, partial [Pachysolen tannophilus NRRL Y-2460]
MYLEFGEVFGKNHNTFNITHYTFICAGTVREICTVNCLYGLWSYFASTGQLNKLRKI